MNVRWILSSSGTFPQPLKVVPSKMGTLEWTVAVAAAGDGTLRRPECFLFVFAQEPRNDRPITILEIQGRARRMAKLFGFPLLGWLGLIFEPPS